MSKYNAKKTTVYGITFDSHKEAERYLHLRSQLASGLISDLKLQEEFVLQRAFTTASGERIAAIKYRADFTYIRNGSYVIEDVKGVKTDVYQMKKKMMAAQGHMITEV